MSERPTPETDAYITSQSYSPTEHQWRCFARKLERERDEAREKIWRLEKQIEGLNNAANERFEEIERVRNELREWQALRSWGGTPEHIHDFIKGQQSRIHEAQDIEKTCEQLERELNEARQELLKLKSPKETRQVLFGKMEIMSKKPNNEPLR